MTGTGYGTECFFIAPIGMAGSPERLRSDDVHEFIVSPAAAAVGLETVRADHISEPGQITRQVISHVLGARAAVADLTGLNPNVFYELAIRHTARLPVALIAEEGQTLPFDLAHMRTIFLDHKAMRSAHAAQVELIAQLQQALEGAIDSPVTTAVDLNALESGNKTERILAELTTTVEDLVRMSTSTTAALDSLALAVRAGKLSKRTLNDLQEGYSRLHSYAYATGDTELIDAVSALEVPIGHVLRFALGIPIGDEGWS